MRFINGNKCTTLVRDVDNRERYACIRAEDIWEISVPFPQFYCEPKTALKKKKSWDFPGGPGVKNLPANAGDTDSSPSPGRSHMPRGN